MATGASPEQALDYVSRVYSNVLILPKNAREATDIFIKRRQGDVLLNYENELILAQQQGQEGTFIIPSPNLVIDNPIAVIDKNVDRRGRAKLPRRSSVTSTVRSPKGSLLKWDSAPIYRKFSRNLPSNFPLSIGC